MKIRQGFVSNSSSSSFICNTTFSVEKIQEMLQMLLNVYNECREFPLSYHDVFMDVGIVNKDYLPHWQNQYSKIRKSLGCKYIQSACDNSIPYGMYEFIEEVFNAERLHLG